MRGCTCYCGGGVIAIRAKECGALHYHCMTKRLSLSVNVLAIRLVILFVATIKAGMETRRDQRVYFKCSIVDVLCAHL